MNIPWFVCWQVQESAVVKIVELLFRTGRGEIECKIMLETYIDVLQQ
jgi:hypothetical protein